MKTSIDPEQELRQLAERYSQVLAWNEAVPNSTNMAAQIDEIESQAIRSGYTMEELHSLLDEEAYIHSNRVKP